MILIVRVKKVKLATFHASLIFCKKILYQTFIIRLKNKQRWICPPNAFFKKSLRNKNVTFVIHI